MYVADNTVACVRTKYGTAGMCHFRGRTPEFPEQILKHVDSSIRAQSGDLSKWDTSSVFSMDTMFSFAYLFNGDVTPWDTSGVRSMYFKCSSALHHLIKLYAGMHPL